MSDVTRLASPEIDLSVPPLGARRLLGRRTYVAKVSLATCAAVVVLWWLAAWLEVVPAMFLPSPVAVTAKFFAVSSDGFQDATLSQHLLASVGRGAKAFDFGRCTVGSGRRCWTAS